MCAGCVMGITELTALAHTRYKTLRGALAQAAGEFVEGGVGEVGEELALFAGDVVPLQGNVGVA